MPICDTKASESPIGTALTEIDQNASELAKIKRVRDHAYFNSYDFDAIDVLPTPASSQQQLQPKAISSSSSTVSSSGTASSSGSSTTSGSENAIVFEELKSPAPKTKRQAPIAPKSTTPHLPAINSKLADDAIKNSSLSENQQIPKNSNQIPFETKATASKSHGYFVRLKSLLSSSPLSSSVMTANVNKNVKSKMPIKRQLSADSAVQIDDDNGHIRSESMQQHESHNVASVAADACEDFIGDENNRFGNSTATIDRNSYNSSSNSSSKSTTNLFKATTNSNCNNSSDLSGKKSKHTTPSGFILPRAILKYPNIEYSVNSMPSSSTSHLSSTPIAAAAKPNKQNCTSETTTTTTTKTSYHTEKNGLANDTRSTVADNTQNGREKQQQQQHQQHHYNRHYFYHDQLAKQKMHVLEQLQQYSLDSNDLSETHNITAHSDDRVSPILSKTFTTAAAVHTYCDIALDADSTTRNLNNTTLDRDDDDVSLRINHNHHHQHHTNQDASPATNAAEKVERKESKTKYSEMMVSSATAVVAKEKATAAANVAAASHTFVKTASGARMQRQLSQNFSERSSDRSSGDLQINNLSHYSTERSNGGSSGYYSSNLCSSSSIEEHIYSEPVIDNLVADVRGGGGGDITRKILNSKNQSASDVHSTVNSTTQTAQRNAGRSRLVYPSAASSSAAAQKLCKLPKGIMMNAKGDTIIGKDNFYMTNRSFNETYVGSGRRFFNNSSLRRSKYLHQYTQDRNRQQQQQLEQGQRYGLYHNDSCPEYTVNYIVADNSNGFGKQHFTYNLSDTNSNNKAGVDVGTNLDDDIKTSKMNESLRNLETSIGNLDRHLKNYPHLRNSTMLLRSTSFGSTASSGHNSMSQGQDSSGIDVSDGGAQTDKVPQQMHNVYLPTIMEGIDSQSSNTKKNQQRSWTDDMLDDSLMDIDLDSFLLVNNENNNNTNINNATTVVQREQQQHKVPAKNVVAAQLKGIDNPSFDANEILIREPMENNYKCSKYINSCPEDAYKVESELEHDLPPMVGNASLSNDKTMAFFLKKYEDQIHFQSTRDMLEDIQVKIRNIAEIAGEDDRVIPKAMENSIGLLKLQLEDYLSIMNRNSELEIKQFCTGVVNNQKLVTLTKAFERRKSVTTNSASCCNSEFEYEANQYESVPKRSCCSMAGDGSGMRRFGSANQLIFDGGSVIRPSNGGLHDDGSVYGSRNGRCISINDKLSFNDLYRLENGELDGNRIINGGGGANGVRGPNGSRTSQMQKNLSYHSPFLDKEDIQQHKHSETEDKNSILEWHRNKPSSWELYYGTNRIHQTVKNFSTKHSQALMSYPSSRPESDFTLDLPRAEQLRLKMDKEKKFRQRCRILTTFLSIVFFLLTVMVVSLVLTRGKRMFGSML